MKYILTNKLVTQHIVVPAGEEVEVLVVDFVNNKANCMWGHRSFECNPIAVGFNRYL